MSGKTAFLLVLFALVVACGDQHADAEPLALDLPLGFPLPELRDDNPFTRESVELGRLLFNEPRLSADGSLSCASCHLAEKSFADNHIVSPGVNGVKGFRNTPSLINLAYHDAFFMDGGAYDLEIQLLAPIHTDEEMEGNIHEAAKRMKQEEPYATLSMTAYGRELDGYVISRAIANYERSLISGNSRFDRWLHNQEDVLTEEEQIGWALFHSKRVGCSNCHSGHLFSDLKYHNIGLYETYEDPGRGRITNDSTDLGKFKTPSMRDVTKTAPYMHDGSIPSLEGVLAHFSAGGVGHTNQSDSVSVIDLSTAERSAIIAFLGTLEGDTVGVESNLP